MDRVTIAFFYMGHGVTVADRGRIENGDYKTIAYIRPSGVIEYREDPERIPADAAQQIRNHAASVEQKFFAEWEALPRMKKYARVMDCLTPGELVSIPRGTPAEETINQYFEAYRARC